MAWTNSAPHLTDVFELDRKFGLPFRDLLSGPAARKRVQRLLRQVDKSAEHRPGAWLRLAEAIAATPIGASPERCSP